MNKFEREFRYYVFKVKDVEEYCTKYSISSLNEIGKVIEVGRNLSGKPPFACVVVENDWPMYEAVWKAIEDYRESEIFEKELSCLNTEQLKVRVRTQRKSIKKLQATIEELKETPRSEDPPAFQ